MVSLKKKGSENPIVIGPGQTKTSFYFSAWIFVLGTLFAADNR